jgi:hypothetical protein
MHSSIAVVVKASEMVTEIWAVSLAFGIVSVTEYFHGHLNISHGLPSGEALIVSQELSCQLLNQLTVCLITGKLPEPAFIFQTDLKQLWPLSFIPILLAIVVLVLKENRAPERHSCRSNTLLLESYRCFPAMGIRCDVQSLLSSATSESVDPKCSLIERIMSKGLQLTFPCSPPSWQQLREQSPKNPNLATVPVGDLYPCRNTFSPYWRILSRVWRRTGCYGWQYFYCVLHLSDSSITE